MVVAKRDPRVQIAPDYLAQRRTQRRPQHTFNLKLKPYALQPFCLAPVIPGETLTNIMMQLQCWSDPLKPTMRNIGWWLQYNFFYVRHRDLPEAVRTVLAENMLNPEGDFSTLERPAASAPLYTYAGGIDWAQMCLEHVTSEYFRDEGEDWNVATVDGLPAVRIYGRGTADAFERLTLEGDYRDDRVDLVDDGHVYVDELSEKIGHWQALRDAGLTEMDYEDFMKTFGSNVRQDENSPNLHRAEDVWMHREFTYPTNTVEPTTGIPAVAAGWRIAKSGGKRIFADEPGFIFGVMNARPKVYLRNQKGSVAGMMADVHTWLPAVLQHRQDIGHILSDQAEGPLPGVFGEGYWVDIRDLLLYGDQYINFAPAANEPPFVALPAADAKRRYAAENEIAQFFAGETPAAKFDVDGLCSLSIQARVKPSTSGLVLGRG